MSHAHLLFEHCFAWISPACDPQIVSLWQQNGGTVLSPFTHTNHTNTTTTGQDQVQQQHDVDQVGIINDQILHQIQFFITKGDHVLQPTDDNVDDEKRINRYFASRVNDSSSESSLGTLDDSIVWIGSQWIVDCLDQHKMLNLAKYIIVPAVSQQQQQREPKEQAALPITKETDDDDKNRQRIESASEDKKQVSESELQQHTVQSVVESQEGRSHVESELRERTEETEEEDSAGGEEEYDYEAEIAAMSKRVITYAPRRSTDKKRKAREESETVVVVRQTFEEAVRGEDMNRIVKRMRRMDTVDMVRTTDKVRRL